MGPNDEWPPSRAAIAQKKSEMIQDTPEDTVREPSQKQRRLRSYPLPSFNEAGENSPRKWTNDPAVIPRHAQLQ